LVDGLGYRWIRWTFAIITAVIVLAVPLLSMNFARPASQLPKQPERLHA
jgi:hypothetical protein